MNKLYSDFTQIYLKVLISFHYFNFLKYTLDVLSFKNFLNK